MNRLILIGNGFDLAHGLKTSYKDFIFWYLDDKEYLQFEEQKINDLYEHVKSYHYLKTSEYRNLMRFLNADSFQVFIVGHSCGLSDRTMFKEILIMRTANR